MKRITLAIPTFNRAELLDVALDSIQSIEVSGSIAVEILVIDNNSEDHTSEVCERYGRDGRFPLIRVIEKRQGLCFARNRVIQESRTPHIAFLDDDIRIAPSWVAGYFEAVEHLGADCVIGPVRPWFEHEPSSLLTPRVIASITSSYSQKGEAMTVVPGSCAHEVPGCNFGVRRQVAIHIGGFSTQLDRVGTGMLAGGDTEFGMRLVKRGQTVVYQPRCAVDHFVSNAKMSRGGLRMRWEGLGSTERIIRGGDLSPARMLRYVAGVGRRIGSSVYHGLRGDIATSFQRELEARRAWTYWRESRRLDRKAPKK